MKNTFIFIILLLIRVSISYSQCILSTLTTMPESYNINGNAEDIANSNFIILHNEWGPSTILSKNDSRIITNYFWLEARLLYAYFDLEQNLYVFIAAENENTGVIITYDKNFQLVEKYYFNNNRFYCATFYNGSILIGSESTVLEIAPVEFKVIKSTSVNMGIVWMISASPNGYMCCGANGRLILVYKGRVSDLDVLNLDETPINSYWVKQNYVVFTDSSISQIANDGKLLQYIHLDEQVASGLFFSIDSNTLFFVLKSGIIRFYETKSLNLKFECTVPDLDSETTEFIQTDMAVESDKLRNPKIGEFTLLPNSKLDSIVKVPYFSVLSGYGLTTNENLVYCNLSGEFGMMNQNLSSSFFYKKENASANGLSTFRENGRIFVWYSDQTEYAFREDLLKYSQITHGGDDVRIATIGYDDDYVYWANNYYDSSKSLVSPIYRRTVIRQKPSKYDFQTFDPNQLKVPDLINKFLCAKKDILGILFDDNTFSVYSYDANKLLFSKSDVIDFALIGNHWMLLDKNGDLIKISRNRKSKLVFNFPEKPTGITFSENGNWLCVNDSDSINLFSFKKIELTKQYNITNLEYFKYVEVNNSGDVYFATEIKQLPKNVDKSISVVHNDHVSLDGISQVTYNQIDNTIFVRFSNGVIKGYTLGM